MWVCQIFPVLYMPYSTVQNVLRRILNFYLYKIKPLLSLQDGETEVRKTFALQFLARMVVYDDWPRNILRRGEVHLCLNGQVPATPAFRQRKTLTLSRNNHYIRKKWQYDVVLRPIFIIGQYLLGDNFKWNSNLFRHRTTVPWCSKEFCNPATSPVGMPSSFILKFIGKFQQEQKKNSFIQFVKTTPWEIQLSMNNCIWIDVIHGCQSGLFQRSYYNFIKKLLWFTRIGKKIILSQNLSMKQKMTSI